MRNLSVNAYKACAAISFVVAFLLFFSMASLAFAQVLTAAHPVRAGAVVTAQDVALLDAPARPGVFAEVDAAIGLEAKVSIYQGRPVRMQDLGPPTIVRRNDVVSLEFRRGGLLLRTDGRALDDGGLGERVRVMNLDSRLTVFGLVAGPNLVETR